MTSTSIALGIFIIGTVASFLTIVGLYFNYRYVKQQNRETTDSFSGVHKIVVQQAEKAIQKITETSDSYEKTLTEKSKHTFLLLDDLNTKIESQSNKMNLQFEAVKNPLFPCKIEIRYELDFTNSTVEQFSAADNLRKYLRSFDSYKTITRMSLDGRLPSMITASPYDGNNQYNHIGFEDTFSRQSLGNKYEPDFDRLASNLLYTALRKVVIILNHTKKVTEMPSFFADVAINLNESRDFSSVVRCNVYFEKKRIIIMQTINNANIDRSTGRVKSLIDCRDGYIGINFIHQKGIKIENPTLTFYYGENQSSVQSITFNSNLLNSFNNEMNTFFAATFK